MFPGINKSIILILFLSPILLKAQFTYRFELLIEKGKSYQSDKVDYRIGNFNYYENTSRTGNAFSGSLAYNLKNSPISLVAGVENTAFNNFDVSSNLQQGSNPFTITKDESQKLKMRSGYLNVRCLFFRRSTIRPFVYAGISYNSFNYHRSNVHYLITGKLHDLPHIDNITWGFNEAQTNFGSFGITSGVGLQFRITDKIGLNGRIGLNYISQKKTNMLEDNLLIRNYNIGIFYRLFKRKNEII